MDWRNFISKTRYTGVTKDDKTGKYTYYFKAGVDLATGKPYQERRRGFQTAKEAFEARTSALNKVQQKGRIKHTQWTFKQFMEEVFMPNYYATTSPDLERRRQVIFDEFISVLYYIFEHDNPIDDGQTIAGLENGDMNPDIKWKVQYEDSLIQPVRTVIDINMGEYASGTR